MNFANIDMHDRPILILKRADGTPIGVLGNATNVEIEPNYNELSILSFNLPAMVDGEETPFYDDVTGQKIIELKDIAQFAVSQPTDSGDKVKMYKTVQAKSLECEFGRKQIALPESTYKFFDSSNTDGTVLGMIMELMPNWTIGTVASSLYNKYRTFDVSGENLYNFIKGTVQQAYNCIFDFDTLTRTVNVRDADATPAEKQVYLSRDNLIKEIEVTENTDDMVTRLEVSGADGVDIREVNPTGSNQIINLDYYMTTDHFSQALVTKYNNWKTLIANNRRAFYNYSIQYAMRVSEELAENAKLTDLRGEYTSLENIQAVIIQGISTGQKRQADLDTANANLRAKQQEIDAKKAEIDSIAAEREATMNSIIAIRNQCAWDKYFTLAERKTMDPYIIDNGVEETSFVASEVQSYTDGAGNSIKNKTVRVTGTTAETSTSAAGSTLYSLTGGSINVAGIITGTVISSIFEKRTNGKVVLSIYISNGSYNGTSFPSGCVSISGTGSVSQSGTTVTCSVTDGYMFFSLNASDYEKKTVAWELYEYGESVLAKMAVPSYTFSVDSANFLALEEFELFKNELELGQRVYIHLSNDRILKPICIGAKFKYQDKPYLELSFSDTFTANDGEAKLVDILDNSISMGKTLSAGKFTYEAWTESGASSELKEFILSALDTAKNAIMSSTEQAVTWDGAGLRLRKYSNAAHTAYEPEQIWINNNSIMMTDSGWATAKMAIGKIHDANVGDKWGIIAEMVVGTMIAGEELVIESQKKDGGTAVFRMDADGCRLYNAEFTIQKTNTDGTTTQILLDPSVGVAMGTYPVKNSNGSINTNNAKFWVDPGGTMHLSGTIISYDGIIGGWTISQDGLYSGTTNATRVGMTSSGDIRIWAGHLDKTKAPFYVKQDGTLHSTLGQIGGWYIGTDYIGNKDTKATSTTGMANGSASSIWTFWAGGAQASAPFRVNTSGKVYASNIEIVGGSIVISDENGNAMFTVTSTGKVTANDITINGGSITIKNNGVTRFNVSRTGKVTINDGSITIKSGDTAMFSVSDVGYMYSRSGQIGGWYIGSDYLGNKNTKANSTVGMYSSDGTDDVVIWAGGKQAEALFRVTGGGKVYASDMDISGGKIGGWFISSTHIGNAAKKADSTVGLSNASGNTDKVFWAGGTTPTFYVQKNGKVYASDLEIVGGSIQIKSGDTVNFEVKSTGYLTAIYGKIGGWHIGSDYIGNQNKMADSTIGLYADATGDDIALWIGAKTSATTIPFYVTANGVLHASGAVVSGTLDAGAGSHIGGWYIGSDYIGNRDQKNTSETGMAAVTGAPIAFWAGGGSDPATANFRVQGNGTVYASNLNISGGSIEIQNSDGTTKFKVTSGGAVTATDLTITGGSITLGTVFSVDSSGYLTSTSGKIGGWFISATHIGNAAAKADSSVGLSNASGDTDKVFWAGGSSSPKFYVQRNGKVYASDLEIVGGSINIKDGDTVNFSVTSTGVLTAKSGSIGGWYFKTDHLGNANTKSGSTVGMSPVASTSTDSAFWAGGSQNSATFRVTGKGKLYATGAEISGDITASTLKIGDKSASDYILSVTPMELSMHTWDSLGSDSKILLTPDKIVITTTGKFSLSATNLTITDTGELTCSKGNIGGWTIGDKQLNSGSGSGYVALNSNSTWDANKTNLVTGDAGEWVQPYAIWCGNATANDAPFRVRRDGTVYIKALCVDGQLIDFTTFSGAVSLASGGSWNGDTFTATVKLWGKINKTINISATATVKSITVDDSMYNDQYAVLDVVYYRTVHGKNSVDKSLSFSQVYVRQIAKKGWDLAKGKLEGLANNTYNVTAGSSKTIKVPGNDYDAQRTITINAVAASGGGCFVAGTNVRRSDGVSVCIEQLTVGTSILAYNEEQKCFTASDVLAVQMFRHKNDIYDVELASGRKITLTGSHPLLTENGWSAINTEEAVKEHQIDVATLQEGDRVVAIDGIDTVTRITYREDLQDTTVYNIDVEPYDTYVVEGVVVHNAESKD